MIKRYKPTILYVEDEDGIRENLSRFLNYFSSNLFLASNGVEGLDIYKREHVDIVITDIQMPKMNGLDMVKAIKEIDCSQIILFTTAFNDNQYLLNAINLAVDGYILKPIDLDKMEEKLLSITKSLNIKKELELRKSIMDEIAQLPDNILIVFDEDEKIVFSNKKFLDFFMVKSIEEFQNRYTNLQSLFIKKDDFFITDIEKGWLLLP